MEDQATRTDDFRRLHVTEHEAAQVERANASSATPVVFVHGLWLLPSSWDRWVTARFRRGRD